MFLWCTASSLTQYSVASWRLILLSGLEVLLFSCFWQQPADLITVHYCIISLLILGIFIILWGRCCKTYSVLTMQCQHWHITQGLYAIITLDNAWPFTDFGQITRLQIQAHQKIPLVGSPCSIRRNSRKKKFTPVVLVVQHESLETQHRLMDLSKGARWPFGWMRGWVGWSCCFHAELSEPEKSTKHTPSPIGKHSPEH